MSSRLAGSEASRRPDAATKVPPFFLSASANSTIKIAFFATRPTIITSPIWAKHRSRSAPEWEAGRLLLPSGADRGHQCSKDGDRRTDQDVDWKRPALVKRSQNQKYK